MVMMMLMMVLVNDDDVDDDGIGDRYEESATVMVMCFLFSPSLSLSF